MEGLPLATDATGTTKTTMQSQKQTIVSELSGEVKPVSSTPVLRLQDVEAVIEIVLDRKLKPITKMLTEAHHEGPTVRDIFGGIGYILGLVGIAAYVHSRKKKE
jgi:nickel transport protein